jgi:hypothetical protein
MPGYIAALIYCLLQVELILRAGSAYCKLMYAAVVMAPVFFICSKHLLDCPHDVRLCCILYEC